MDAKLRGRLIDARGRPDEEVNDMSKEKVPSQTAHRSSESGRFVTEKYAERHPDTTERERIKHPK